MKQENSQQTLIMLKPQVLSRKLVNKFIAAIEESNLNLLHVESKQLVAEEILKFYAHIPNHILVSEIVPYMISEKVICIIVEGNNAISKVRTLVGATDPNQALPGTLRMRFAESKKNNLIHSSENENDFKQEIQILNLKW